MQFQSFVCEYTVAGKKEKLSHNLLSGFSNEALEIKTQSQALQGGRRLRVMVHPKQPLELTRLYLEGDFRYQAEQRLFLNGYQTWTVSREYGIRDSIERLNRLTYPVNQHFHFKQYGDYGIYPYRNSKGWLHSYTYSYVREQDDFYLIGSLSEREGYTIIQHITPQQLLQIHKDCAGQILSEETVLFDLVFLSGSEQAVFDQYFSLMHIKPPKVGMTTGYTSWYNHYTNISEANITESLQAYIERKVPIDMFQIDDGYQQAVGDWLVTNHKFPNGMRVVSDRIHQAGYQAGLWLAPFICEKNSELFREHPDWLQQDNNGKPLVAGYCHLWSGNFYALNIEHPEVRDYLRTVFNKVLNEWNFDMVKLDFLYAVCLVPFENKTRGQIMCEAMDLLRELVGEKLILGCGVPLGPSFGKVDYCRISCDIALKWEDWVLKNVIHYRERVSTISAIINSIYRRQLHNRAFVNDPDVFLLRDENIEMSPTQRHTLFLVNQVCGGLLFTSDNIGTYSEQTRLLFMSQFPAKERTVVQVDAGSRVTRIAFRSGEADYLLCCNLSGMPALAALPKGLYYYKNDLVQSMLVLMPYESRCLRRLAGGDYVVAGSTGHLFPGMDVDEFQLNQGKIHISLSPQANYSSTVMIKVPDSLSVEVNGELLSVQTVQGVKVVRYQHRPE